GQIQARRARRGIDHLPGDRPEAQVLRHWRRAPARSGHRSLGHALTLRLSIVRRSPMRSLILALISAFVTAMPGPFHYPQAHAAEANPSKNGSAGILSASELGLPAFQETSLEQDLPARDLFFSESDLLWILGKRYVWS